MAKELLRQLTKACAGVRGLRRIPEYCQKKHSSDDGIFTIHDFDTDLKYESTYSSHIGSHVFWMGQYARSVLGLISRVLDRRDSVVFDIGANEGEETLFCAKRVPSGKVFSFEPNASVRARLVKNVALNNFTNVSIEPVGLSDEPGTLTLYAPAGRHADGTLNAGQATVCPRAGVDKPIGEITLSTMDIFVKEHELQQVDLIKIDVEGAELMVLKGGKDALQRMKPKLIVEVWEGEERSRELLRYITDLGYIVHNIAPDGSFHKATDLSRTSRDVFCIAN